MHYRDIALGLLAIAPAGVAAAPQARLPVKTVYQEAKPFTWFENIAVRSNGKVLLTSISAPAGVHQVDPFAAEPTTELIAPLPRGNVTSRTTTGITEGAHDVFYVAVLTVDPATGGAVPGTNNVVSITFDAAGGHKVAHVAHVADAILLNGMVALSPTTLLVADPQAGKIFSVDTTTGKHFTASADPAFVPPKSFPFTVNGLKFRLGDRKHLYFTSTANSLFGRMPITANGTQAGPIERLATASGTGGSYDDFTFGPDGNAYATIGAGNEMQKITFDAAGNFVGSSVIAGHINSTAIAQPASAAFGRTAADKYTLYVSTAGGTATPVVVKGKATRVGAQLDAIKLQ